jgi:hypothetical protein
VSLPFYFSSLNPIWSVDNGSLFILSYTAEELFSYAAGLTFLIKDYDGLSSNDTIGKVEVSPTNLLAMTGDRTELVITAMGHFKSKTRYFKPKLQLRVRKATAKDLEFLKELHAIKKSKKLGIYADQSFVAPHSNQVRLLARESKTVDGVKLVSQSQERKKEKHIMGHNNYYCPRECHVNMGANTILISVVVSTAPSETRT